MSGISLSGLISGLDTNTMIDSLMKLEKIPYNNLETKKTALTSNQTLIRNLNTKILALKTSVTDLMYSDAYKQSSASVSDSTVMSVSAAENAAPGSYSVKVNQLAQKHVVSSAESKATDAWTLPDPLDDSFNLYGKGSTTPIQIKLSGSTNKEVLNNLSKSINDAKAGVTASVIETSPGNLSLVLTSDEFGEDSDIQFGTLTDTNSKHAYIDGSDSLLKALGLMKSDDNTMNTRQPAKNAEVELNGILIKSATNTLTNVVSGVTINLLKKDATSTITVAKDTSKVADKIQAFVNAYNDAITLVRESSSKGAVMQGDSTLRMLQTELSDLVNGFVGGSASSVNAGYGGTFKLLSEIGLEVDKGMTSGSQMTGKLSFDLEKFTAAFNKDSESVNKLFAYDGTGNKKDAGIAVRMFEGLNNWTKTGTGLLAFKLSGYDSDIKMITEQMATMNLRLTAKQAKLQAQFGAMETALSSLKSTQSWLTSQITSMTANSNN